MIILAIIATVVLILAPAIGVNEYRKTGELADAAVAVVASIIVGAFFVGITMGVITLWEAALS